MDEGLLGQIGQGLQNEKYLTWSGIWMRVCLARLVRVYRMRSISPGQVYGEGLLGQIGQGLQNEKYRISPGQVYG